MDKNTRIDRIKEVKDRSSDDMKEEIVWEDVLQAFPVYKIPLEYLVYNKYNGRILTRTKSLESQGKSIEVETREGKETIERLLWESKPDRNKQTLNDLEKFGQKRVGIVTADGIIIDGNRRAMLLDRSKKYNYFKAIVLPVTLEQNPLEIEKLETSYQMGEDEKLSYNPIEKYLKAQNLKRKNVEVEDIAKWMGEPEKEVEKYIRTMAIMDEYLLINKYDGMYTQLYGREDSFLSLEKWTTNFYEEKSARAFDGYKDSDVDDLKSIVFDYIRADYEGKSMRIIADGSKESHFFGDKNLWRDFCETHFRNIEPIKFEEDPIKFENAIDLEKSLNSRDGLYKLAAIDLLTENLVNHRDSLGNQKYANEPEKLISKAIDAAKVAQSNKNIGRDGVMEKVEELNDITVSIMRKKAPAALLRYVTSLLTSIDAETCGEDKSDIETELKNIQREAYRLSKEI